MTVSSGMKVGYSVALLRCTPSSQPSSSSPYRQSFSPSHCQYEGIVISESAHWYSVSPSLVGLGVGSVVSSFHPGLVDYITSVPLVGEVCPSPTKRRVR